MLLPVTIAAAMLLGETSEPRHSFFFKDREAKAVVTASGFAAGETREIVCDVRTYKDDPVKVLKREFTADAKGGAKIEFPLPTDAFGCFRVSVKSGEIALAKRGSCPAGLMTYGVVHDPATRPDISADDAFFGGYGETDQYTGFRHSLGGIVPTMDPKERRERREKALARTGWKVYGTCHVAQMFRPHVYPWTRQFYSPEGLKRAIAIATKHDQHGLAKFFEDPVSEGYLREAFRNLFAAAKAAHLPGAPKRFYELPSEVDLNIPRPSDVVKLAAIAREELEKADPEGVLGYPGVSNIRDSSVSYTQHLVDLGLLEYLNAFTLHPYTAYPPEPSGFVRNVRMLSNMIEKRLGRMLPLYSTEQGFATPGTVEGELKKLNGQLRVNLILLGEGYERSYAFYRHDFGNDDNRDKDGDYGLMFNLELDKTRYGSRSFSPRAIACGFSAATWILDGKRPTACLEGVFGPNSLGYAYADRANAHVVLALWNFMGPETEAEVPVGRDAVVVSDVMGNERTVSAPGGKLKVRLSETPFYVIGVEPKMWGRGGTTAGELVAKAKAEAARREAAIRLKCHGARSAFAGVEPAVEVDLENRTAKDDVVTVEVRCDNDPDARASVSAPIAARTKATVRVAMTGWRPDPAKMLKVDLSARLGEGYTVETSRELNFWRAERVKGGVFRPSVHYAVPREFSGKRFAPPSPESLSAEMAFGWDGKWLYADVLVTDNVHTNAGIGFNTWRGDAIQFGFARQILEKMTENNLTDMALQAPSEITFALTPRGPEVYRTATFDPMRFPALADGTGAVRPEDAPFTATRVGGVTHYAIRVPWRFLNMERPEGSFCVAAFINDTDDYKLQSMPMNMMLFDLKAETPRKFGRIVLGDFNEREWK